MVHAGCGVALTASYPGTNMLPSCTARRSAATVVLLLLGAARTRPGGPGAREIDYATAMLQQDGQSGARRGRDCARRRARRAGLERRPESQAVSSRTIRAKASRPRTTPRCACSTTTTRSISACSPRTTEPGRIIVNDLKKDFNTDNSDGFRIILDTFHDERNGYQFATNPAGAKWDAQMANEGRENNANWDGIWDVATRIGETAGTPRSGFRSGR